MSKFLAVITTVAIFIIAATWANTEVPKDCEWTICAAPAPNCKPGKTDMGNKVDCSGATALDNPQGPHRRRCCRMENKGNILTAVSKGKNPGLAGSPNPTAGGTNGG